MTAIQPDVEQEVELLRRALTRERAARKTAERILEERSRALFESKQELECEHQVLQITQAQLVQSEKMASLGQLAAGVAHEINNPIGFVASNVSTLTDYTGVFAELLTLYGEMTAAFPDSANDRVQELQGQIAKIRDDEDIDFVLEDVRDLLSESADGLVRVKEIVQDLKSFARLDEADVKSVDINAALESTLKVAANELKYHCKVVRDFGEIPHVKCHAGQVNQVFLNLLVNAAQAIEEAGTVTVQTRLVGDKVLVRIMDDGVGIEPEHLQNIFTPFFTTKPVGKGTGLGLSVSYNIIEQHGGHIDVESEVGYGTTFAVQLPIGDESDPEAPRTGESK